MAGPNSASALACAGPVSRAAITIPLPGGSLSSLLNDMGNPTPGGRLSRGEPRATRGSRHPIRSHHAGGTWADGERCRPDTRYRFGVSVSGRLPIRRRGGLPPFSHVAGARGAVEAPDSRRALGGVDGPNLMSADEWAAGAMAGANERPAGGRAPAVRVWRKLRAEPRGKATIQRATAPTGSGLQREDTPHPFPIPSDGVRGRGAVPGIPEASLNLARLARFGATAGLFFGEAA